MNGDNGVIFQRRKPAILSSHRIDVPIPVKLEAGNGIPVHILDVSDQDVIRVSFVFHAGTSLQKVPFSASSAANLLAEGSGKHNAKQIAERLDYFGSYYDVTLDRDYTVITFASLAKYFGETLEVAREILLGPVFPEKEIATYREKRKQRLAVERKKVSFKARELFAKSLFGVDHPYGVSYPESCYDGITREVVEGFYKDFYIAENCFVVASGKVSGVHRELIMSFAGEIEAGIKAATPHFPEPVQTKNIFEPSDGAVQSAIRMGRMLFPRSHPDFIPMQVVTTILGGYFGSRLVHNLREVHGYTYGAFAGMVNMEQAGYLAIATEVASDATVDSVAQIFFEIEKLRSEPVTPEELKMVKSIMTGEIMRILDGPFGIADVTIENFQSGTDNSYLDRFIEQINGITPEIIMEVASKYLNGDDFSTVVVGNPGLEGYFRR